MWAKRIGTGSGTAVISYTTTDYDVSKQIYTTLAIVEKGVVTFVNPRVPGALLEGDLSNKDTTP